MEGRRGRRGRRFYFLSKKRLGSGNRLRSSSWRNASGMHPSGMEVISQSAWRGFRHSASSGIEIQRHFRFTSSDIFPNISAQLKNCIQQSSNPPLPLPPPPSTSTTSSSCSSFSSGRNGQKDNPLFRNCIQRC